MSQAYFRFHGELNDFLPKDKQGRQIPVTFSGHETVKHLHESLGVPHTEVNFILVNGISVDFSTRLQDNDQVDLYPVSDSIDIEPIIHLQPEYDLPKQFIADGHLGKLSSYLRLLGIDVLYHNDYEDDELAAISSHENRILLTRDRGLLKRNQVKLGYFVRSKSPREQTVEVLRRFDLGDQTQPFSRCARCNGLLLPAKKADIYDRLEPKTKLYYDDFRICQQCGKIYWAGSHFERMAPLLKTFVESSVDE